MISVDWQNAAAKFELKENEVHVWLLDLFSITESDKKFESLLSEEEKLRKDKFHFKKDRITYGTTRGILRTLLGKYTNIPSRELSFVYNKYGKPFLNSEHKINIKFNVSHSNNYAMIALNITNDIGIDLESVNETIVTEEIASNYFSQVESNELFKLPKIDRINAFFRIWTRKEAFIKAVGRGLSIPLDSFDVNNSIDNPRLLRYKETDTFECFHLYDLSFSDEYFSALMLIGKRKKILKYLVNKDFGYFLLAQCIIMIHSVIHL